MEQDLDMMPHDSPSCICSSETFFRTAYTYIVLSKPQRCIARVLVLEYALYKTFRIDLNPDLQ